MVQFSLYFAFSAVVMVYVYAIQQRNSPPETYMHLFQAATRCQSQIVNIATPGSLAHRYGLVLQELRLELLRLNTQIVSAQGEVIPSSVDAGTTKADSEMGMAQDSGQMGGEMGAVHMLADDVLGFSPGSSIVQMAGWSQFDSLVCSPSLSF